MNDTVAIPDAPTCATWCEGHQDAEHGRWDAFHRFAGGVEVAMWCHRRSRVATQAPEALEIVVERFSSWTTGNLAPVVDAAKVMVEPYEFTPDEADQFAEALVEAARLAR